MLLSVLLPLPVPHSISHVHLQGFASRTKHICPVLAQVVNNLIKYVTEVKFPK